MGIVVAFISLSLGFGLSSILKEKEDGTLKRLYITLSSPFPIIMGNILAMLFTTLIQVSLILGTMKYLFKIPLGISLYHIITIIMFYTALLISIILYLATFDEYISSIQGVYASGMIITSMVGGCFWSLDLLPLQLQKLALLTPQGLTMISLKLVNMGYMGKGYIYCGLMFLISILFISLSKKRLEYYV